MLKKVQSKGKADSESVASDNSVEKSLLLSDIDSKFQLSEKFKKSKAQS